MKFIYKENLEGKCKAVEFRDKIKFDGRVNPRRWGLFGFPSDEIPGEYVMMCKDGAINLHIFGLGQYKKCSGCEYKNDCIDIARVSKEQAEFL